MTDAAYEEQYAEALEIVKGKLVDKTIGEPRHTSAGTRFVFIDGKTYSDEKVFTMAWGKETARKIIAESWVPRR